MSFNKNKFNLFKAHQLLKLITIHYIYVLCICLVYFRVTICSSSSSRSLSIFDYMRFPWTQTSYKAKRAWTISSFASTQRRSRFSPLPSTHPHHISINLNCDLFLIDYSLQVHLGYGWINQMRKRWNRLCHRLTEWMFERWIDWFLLFDS